MQPFFIKRCYVKEISQNLHRLLSLAALVICIAAEVQAADYYGFKIGGVSVTSENCTNVTGSNITAYDTGVNGGNYSVSYDPTTNTVTLYNVKIERTGSGNRAILNESCDGLTVVLKGVNWLQAEDASPVRLNANTTIKGQEADGLIRTYIRGGTQDAITIANAATLIIRDATLEVYAKSHCFIGVGNSSDNPDDWATLVIDGSYINANTSEESFTACLCKFKQLTFNNSNGSFYGRSGAAVEIESFTKEPGMRLLEGSERAYYKDKSFYTYSTIYVAYSSVHRLEMSMSTEATGVPIDETTFPDPNLRKKISDDYDENGDGYLSDEERETACKIGFVTKSVANTQGLEYFYAMESLDCRGNNITLIDLTPFKKLKNIMLKRNYLTSLDLSQNTSLTSIGCEQNLLTTLDFSECKSVHYIDCSENNIRGAGMDRLVYSLPTIKSGQGRLYVKYKGAEEQDNEMTKAQVLIAKSKGWTPLIILSRYSGIYGGIAESEEYEGVDDGTNVGFVIDAAHFPDAAFRAVVASTGVDRNQDGFLSDYERQQTSVLNLQGKGIRNLQGIEYYEEMQKLNCQDNNLTELDLSNNKGIKGVYLYGNNICGEAMDRLIESLPNRPSSDKGALFVICDGKSPDNAMTNLQVEAAKAKGWNAFRSTNDGASWVFYAGEDVGFAIDEQHFPDENFRAYILQEIDYDQNGYLSVSERLNVKYMGISDMGIASVLGIRYFPDLEELDCRSNQLTSLDLQYNPKLKRVYCANNQLRGINISQNLALEYLSCTNNQITNLSFENIPHINNLYISKNKIRGEAMTQLVNSLPYIAGDLCALDDEAEDGNSMSFSQIKIAYYRGWDSYEFSSDIDDWRLIRLSEFGVPIDEGNFPDEAFRNYVKKFDTDDNGALSDEERAVVTEMDVIGNVADLMGVENFTALKRLKVQNQQLTYLEVFELTELESLACGGNQLTFINVSENKKLKSLGCGNNQIETIYGLPECTALEELWCDNNQLTELDLSDNTALATLSCSDNQLTTLDLKKNTELADLRCYNNQLTTLDLSTNVNLEYLYCNNNRLTTILTAPGTPKEDFSCKNNCLKGRVMTDIVNNLPVVEGKAIYFRSMKDTEENEMTSAQVNIATGKGWKVRMDWYYDGLEDYEGYWVELAIDEKNFPDAKFRNYVGRFIDKDGDGYLRDEERLSVKSLNISNNNIADLTGIKFFTNLEELDCSNNKIATFDLSENTSLKSLNCSRNLLTRLLFGNEVLEEVDCSDNQIEELSLWSPALKTVDCYNNKLKEEGSTAWFIDALPETEDGKLYFHYDGDENTISHQQVIAANKKGWKVFYNNDSSWHKYKAYVKGDADGDGVVDVNDVTTTINHILGKPVATFIPEAANVDGDDTIDVNDVQGIINIALGKAGD